MGHNPTPRSIERQARKLSATDTPGWQLIGERWRKVMTVDGVIARRAQLRAKCASAECSRRVRVNLARWKAMGLGALGLDEVRGAYRCGLLCRLDWLADFYAEGPSLMCWAGARDTKVVVSCLACRAEHRREVAEFAAAIERAGVASCNISYRNLGGHLIRGACRRCGERRWHVRLDPTPSPKLETMGLADLA